MIACADRNGTNVITLSDVRAAVSWLLEAEKGMANMFMAFKTGGDANVMDEARHYLQSLSYRAKGGNLPPMNLLWEYLSTRVPSYRIQAIIDTMIRGGYISTTVVDTVTFVIVKARRH
jgi:hypothetical protein